jgi:putative hydrolase of the HAD superfamily
MTAHHSDSPRPADKAIVFDFGGVLLDWNPPALLRRLLPAVAHDDASARHWAGEIFQSYGGDWFEFDRGRIEPEPLARLTAERTGLPEAELLRVIHAVPAELAAKHDTVALLERLHAQGRRLFYLSNMPAPYADYLLRTHPFMRLFADGVISARVHHNKPSAEVFRVAQAQFGLPADDLVFMDDHAPNVQAARAEGWNAFVFASAAQAERELRERGWMKG